MYYCYTSYHTILYHIIKDPLKQILPTCQLQTFASLGRSAVLYRIISCYSIATLRRPLLR